MEFTPSPISHALMETAGKCYLLPIGVGQRWRRYNNPRGRGGSQCWAGGTQHPTSAGLFGHLPSRWKTQTDLDSVLLLKLTRESSGTGTVKNVSGCLSRHC